MSEEHDRLPDEKRPYEPPTIEETAPFEQLRLGCTQADINCQLDFGPPLDTS